ncbi:MAG: DUF5102 domain-containing protein [Candidatus Thiodiazotropha lotti]|nr:DUF5102 domain-containing protein [Candidatus Thiodiazotropha lotti]
MSALEENLFDELDYEEAEGMAEFGDEFEMDEMEYDEFDDEFDEFDDEDSMDEGVYAFDEYGDEFDDEFGEVDEFYDEYDDFDAFEFEDADEALDDVMAYALGAEDADEFFGRLFKKLKSVGKKVVRGIKKAAPVVGKIAGGISKVAKMIPHPYAQAIGRVAGVVNKGARLAQRLRMEGASEEEALEAFAEMASKDTRAIPMVAGLTAKTILKSKSARLSPAARKRVVKQMKGAAKNLVRKRGPKAIRALPKIAKSVKRNAAVKGTPSVTALKVVRRTANKVAKSPALTRKLAKPSVKAKRTVKKAGADGKGRSYVIQGPARITISAA